MNGVDRVAVVIPARDEEALIARCLASVQEARNAVSSMGGVRPLRVDTIVVADRCTDRTAAIARGFEGTRVLTTGAGNVGIARATGVSAALRMWPFDHHRTWIANTDADSVVPPHWLLEQLALANEGHDVVIGTVCPDFADLTPAQIMAWHAEHVPGVANGHVHGANLGVRADWYSTAGGFPPAPEHEDVMLVDRLVARGASVIATAACEVLTSGRQNGRTPGGYAAHLREELGA